MNTTLSMWLGIAFVFLGVAAVLLQAWLWNPRYWDEVNKRTRAPRYGLFIHRWVGITFTLIYIAMMFEMVPRLWEYQVELPARTVVHAVAAIVLGILLFTKLIILWFFRHFEESMPTLGFGILLCTLILGTLSLPFAVRAQGIGVAVFEPANLARTERLLEKLDFSESGLEPKALVTEEAFTRGRKVLVDECVRCHDMRTILAEPKSASGWFKVVERMTEKPSVFGDPIRREDVPYVTAYLVAITPEIHESRQLVAEQERQRQAMAAGMAPAPAQGAAPAPAAAPAGQAVAGAPAQGAAPAAAPAPAAEPKPEPEPVPEAKGEALLEQYCVDCHEMDEVTDYGGATVEGWAQVIVDMIDEGAEIPEEDGNVMARYLAQKFPKE